MAYGWYFIQDVRTENYICFWLQKLRMQNCNNLPLKLWEESEELTTIQLNQLYVNIQFITQRGVRCLIESYSDQRKKKMNRTDMAFYSSLHKSLHLIGINSGEKRFERPLCIAFLPVLFFFHFPQWKLYAIESNIKIDLQLMLFVIWSISNEQFAKWFDNFRYLDIRIAEKCQCSLRMCWCMHSEWSAQLDK